MLQRHVLRNQRLAGVNNATMASDGKGMLVVAVADDVQVWHVGSMELVRSCYPFGGDDDWEYNRGISTQSIGMHTVVTPIGDVLGPGEGSYYGADRERDAPPLLRIGEVQGSRNPLDLSGCDAISLLSRFTHLTYDEQRSFEKKHNLGSGACSPQLDCIVRVALAYCDEEDECQVRIVQLDINCFHHLRHRESVNWNRYCDESIEEVLWLYDKACNGNGLWAENSTFYGSEAWSGYQSLYAMDWSRGGLFDYDGGPSCNERLRKLNAVTSRTLNEGENLSDHPQLLEHYRDYLDIQNKQILHQRRITCLAIDAAKLIICTGYEVSILPFALEFPGMNETQRIPEEWREGLDDPLTPDTNTWHSYRPLDDMLVDCWSHIRQLTCRAYAATQRRKGVLLSR